MSIKAPKPPKVSKDHLTPEKRAKVTQSIHDFHANENKPTSAGSIKEPRALTDVRRRLNSLTEPSADIIRKAVTGALTAEMSVWKGTEEEKTTILQTNPSASFKFIFLDNGKEVEVLIEYVPVPSKRVEIAKWLITQDIALKKAAEESKLRKLELAMREKKAKDDGAIPKEDPQQAAREFGKPRLLGNFSMDYNEEDEEEIED